MTDTCGCCEGIEQITPITIINRPGLSTLLYRMGTHETFFETMLARLSSLGLVSDNDAGTTYPLQSLTTRSTDDPAIALLDAWAIMGDVLTFYQERIVNEGYLRTARHRRSILELARLVSYKLRPGVASSTYLAYTLQDGYNTLIPAGSRVQNIPAAGQLPQSFETSQDLQARAAWNNLRPRMRIPQYITQLASAIDTNVSDGSVFAAGTSTNLKPNDPVLFVFGNNAGEQVFAHVQGVTPHAAEKYTSVSFPTIFTPLAFLRNTLGFVDRYLDLASFGVNTSDPGVDEVTPLLELIKLLLILGKQYLQQLAIGNVQAATLQAVGRALILIGAVLLWLEHLLDQLISGGSVYAIDDTLEALHSLLEEIQRDTDKSVATLLQAVQTALQRFLQQTVQPDLLQSVINLLQPFTDEGQYGADVSALAQAVTNALQPFVQQTDPQLSAILSAVGEDVSKIQLTGTDAKKLVDVVRSAFVGSWDLLTVLLVMQQTLSALLTQVSDQHVMALIQASLGMLDTTLRGEIDTLLQAIDDALDSFLTGTTDLFAADSSVVGVINQSRAVLLSAPELLVRASAHLPGLLSATVAPSIVPAVSKISKAVYRSGFPPNPLQDTLDVWCNVYQNAAKNRQINVANWVGALLIDIKNMAAAVPGIEKILGKVCTPAVISSLGSQVGPLTRPANAQPRGSASLPRSVQSVFARNADIAPQLLVALQPQIASTLYTAYGNAQVTPPPALQAFNALRVKASPFGSNAPQKATTTQGQDSNKNTTFTTTYSEWPIADILNASNVLDLDARYDHIVPETWVVIEGASSLNPPIKQKAIKIQKVEAVARADYGISAKVTRLTLYEDWLTSDDLDRSPLDLSLLRGITVYAQSEQLALANVPLTDDIAGQDIELDDLYNGLQSGRWVVVSGERTDIPHTTGVQGSELMMLASVTQDVRRTAPTLHFSASDSSSALDTESSVDIQPPAVALPGDTVHTTLHFATPLAYTYKRNSVVVNGNVVHATQGETLNQILGSGSGSTSMQQFSLAKSPLTYIPAVTPTGEASTLQVFVNNVRWHEVDSLDTAQETDRVYTTQADDQDKVTITFGDGVHGARLPTGSENVKAIYRKGIGTSGNVDVGKITQLLSKPLGVKVVNNPIAATGGADREGLEQARANVPLATSSLGRIVSIQDYTDFARTFAGIGKASSSYLSDGMQQVVHLTIAGQDTIPLDPTSSLYQSLAQSLHTFGDPAIPFLLALADIKLLILSARVSILPDYLFNEVAAALRTALLAAFSFEQRNLGQPVYESEVLSVMQQVAGVAYVDIDILDAISQQQLTDALQQIQADALQVASSGQQANNPPDLATLLGLQENSVVPAALAQPDPQHPGAILPAQLVCLTSDVQDTLILNQLTALTFKPAALAMQRAGAHTR